MRTKRATADAEKRPVDALATGLKYQSGKCRIGQGFVKDRRAVDLKYYIGTK
jgi:hypothetical protein